MWSARQLQLQGDSPALRPPPLTTPLPLAPTWEILQVILIYQLQIKLTQIP